MDEDSDGKIDNVIVSDLTKGNLHVNVSDQGITSYDFSTGLKRDDLTFTDHNLDGEYDYRLGPGADFAIRVDCEWHKMTIEDDGRRFIDRDGQRTELEHVDGMWQVAKGKQ